MIRHSVGSNMFRNLYMSHDGSDSWDAMQDGQLSCAFYVSAVLTLFQLADHVHGLVDRTVDDLERRGWQAVSEPSPGDVIVWKPADEAGELHPHIGFYIGQDQAVSNSTTRQQISQHHYTYNNSRTIDLILHCPDFRAVVDSSPQIA